MYCSWEVYKKDQRAYIAFVKLLFKWRIKVLRGNLDKKLCTPHTKSSSEMKQSLCHKSSFSLVNTRYVPRNVYVLLGIVYILYAYASNMGRVFLF
jgi:hypothetical protein